MSQSRGRSLIEAFCNIVVGAIVALCSQLFLFPLYNIHVDIATDLMLTFWFTLISLVRSYAIRRFMNRRDK